MAIRERAELALCKCPPDCAHCSGEQVPISAVYHNRHRLFFAHIGRNGTRSGILECLAISTVEKARLT